MTKWKIVRNDKREWVVYRDGQHSATLATRAEARQWVSQQRILEKPVGQGVAHAAA